MRLLLLASLPILGCAHGPRAPPLTGWRELRSTHFLLRTDLPEGSARTTLDKLEALRLWLQAAWSTGGDSPGSSDAMVLDSGAELVGFTEMPGMATTTRRGPLLVAAGTDAVLFGDRSPGLPVLAHEVAHELIRRRMPGAPRWFHEGLAGYLQTVTPLEDRRVRFGYVEADRPPPKGGTLLEAMAEYRHKPEVTLAGTGLLFPRRLLSLDETASRGWETASEADLTDLYLSARLWVYLLRTEEPGRMHALERALAGDTPWRVAWAELRSGLDVARLTEKFWRLVQAGGWPSEVRMVDRTPPAEAAVVERTLPPWEVHLALADLWTVAAAAQGGEERTRAARAELEAAARAAPDEASPQVRLAELETDPEARLERAEVIARGHPDSPEAAVFLARVLRDDGRDRPGRARAIARAVALAPEDPDALTAEAAQEARAGDVPGALRSARRAVTLAPWSPTAFRVLANLLAATARCEEALDAAQRGLDVLPHRASPAELEALLATRERIRTGCPTPRERVRPPG